MDGDRLPQSTAFVPSTPDPSTTALVAAVVRSVLMLLSGLGIAVGAVGALSQNADAISVIAGALVAGGTAVWSLWEKFKSAKADHAGSERSAAAGMAVRLAR